MQDSQKVAIAGELEAIELRLSRSPDFFQDTEARGVFVVLLTLRGAMGAGDVEDLAHECVAFAERKQRAQGLPGNGLRGRP
jgi:hypothetical protein